MYAVDLQIYFEASINNLFLAVSQINSDLDTISQQQTLWLNINPKKSQAIIINGAKQIAKINWYIISHS